MGFSSVTGNVRNTVNILIWPDLLVLVTLLIVQAVKHPALLSSQFEFVGHIEQVVLLNSCPA